MELKVLVSPFLPIVCLRVLEFFPSRCEAFVPYYTSSHPQPRQTVDLRDLGLSLGVCYIQHTERGRYDLDKEPVNNAERSGAWSGRYEVKDIDRDKS